ncbi:type I polyketide synthase [Streptomyces profundus]|uniref:type I polyketide synthase n=1 Tax=Streptomyces profundus TaxID=2867410 RepID=UPI001D165C04|nr:type I polyketide synthase [Streptomyces sp. MA3_2.13]UED87559.1 type I polyketide synthase [Streptomyces sp. MA3_2.13]
MPHDHPVPTPREPIAIVGLAGRFADASTPTELWRMLVDGRDAVTEIPPERYDIDSVYDPRPRVPGRTISRWGGLLRDVDAFDAEFFGISPREADRMDPQQRLLLETAYEAVEDAGLTRAALAGGDGGVFVGQLGGDYWHLQYAERERLDLHAMTGAASRAITSGRLSYAFDLRGPSVTVDTACSSALVAVHHAVQALRLGECPVAIAGGVNLVLLPEEGVVYSGAGMLAADGRCKFADASGDGFVRSDGVGVVVLKRLADARADGDRVRAVLLGSAIGNDGDSSGYLVTPSVEGQRRVLRRAYADAGVDPRDVDYVEAHGTGTSVGDPVELAALAEVLGPRAAGDECLVGSVKTNIGHAEAAAGIAGLIKAVLCLEHGTVPPNLHLTDPNPAVAWDELPLTVPTRATRLPARDRPALAGVSSFGFSGTNAHLVLQAAPPADDTGRESDEGRARLLVLSAATTPALRASAAALAEHLAGDGAHQSLRDICHTAATRRTPQEARLALAVEDRTEAAKSLRAFAEGQTEAGLATSDYTAPGRRPRIAFVFPGQGSQWPGMAQELLDQEPVFARTMAACDQAIHAETGWSVREVLRAADEERLAELDVIQPTLWAIEISLAALWRSWGVEPDVVIGHSMGESAAAQVSGALSLADAASVICRRSRLAKALTGRGTMAWVALPAAQARQALAGHEERVAVAAVNSPTSTLLSGDPEALDEILAALDAREVDNRRVNVDFASHCPQMDELREPLLAALEHLKPRAGRVPLHSTVLGEAIDGAGMDAAYWARNLREPVDFVAAVQAQLDEGDTVFVEMSPHPLLVSGIREVAGEHPGVEVWATGSIRRYAGARADLLGAAAVLHTAGVEWDAAALNDTGRFVPLPGYPWQRTRHWLTPATAPAEQAAAHPLLGEPVPGVAGALAWEGPLSLDRHAYLRDHRVQDAVIVPGTAHLELITAAAGSAIGAGPLSLSQVRYHRALFLDEDGPTPSVRVTLAEGPPGVWRARILTRDEGSDDGWLLHTEAEARRLAGAPPSGLDDLATVRERCPEQQRGAEFYPWHAARGNQWNGAFRAIERVWRRDGEALAELSCPASIRADVESHHFHPALLDASGHAMAAARAATAPGEEGVFVLGGIEEFQLYRRPPAELVSHARLRESDRRDSFTADIDVRERGGALVARLVGLRLQYLSGQAPEPLTVPEPPASALDDQALHTVVWEPVAAEAAESGGTDPDNFWLVLSDSGPTGRALVRGLGDRGERVVVVTTGAGPLTGTGERYRLDPAREDHYRQLLAEVAREPGRCRGIVHLWALDAVAGLDASDAEIRRAQLLAGESVVSLCQALEGEGLEGAPLWLVTRHAQATRPGERVRAPFQALLWGLGRTVAAEASGLGSRLVDLDRSPASVARLVASLRAPDREDQIAVRGGKRLVARLVPAPAPASGARALTLASPGVLDDLGLTDLPPAGRLADDEVRIRVSHAGVNYRDVLLSVGMYPGQDEGPPVLGWECAGTVVEVGRHVHDVAVGDEVIALAEGALASRVTTLACLTAPRPRSVGAAEAAALPAAYLTAFHSLHELAGVGRGDTVLVHSATGGTGRAALAVARWRGARVFATAGSAEKRRLLTELGVEGVADSRTLEFARTFGDAVGDDGFDVICNTLAGPAIEANLSLMAPYGRYLELGKRDILENNALPLGAFARNLSFHAVDVVHMIQHAPRRAGRILRAVAELVDRGELPALPHRVHPAEDAAGAFRLMATSRHTGKIVIAFDADAASPGPAAPTVPVSPHGDGTYLVTGGAGGIGGALVRWLADQGARRLLLTGRRPLAEVADSEEWPALLAELTGRGVQVDYAAVDVADEGAMRALLGARRAAGSPPVRGVFHAAGVIDYRPLSELRPAELTRVLAAKVSGAWNLHRILAQEPVDAFVLFSSGSALLGSPLLAGYAAGNAFLDALAQHRHGEGQPATVVNWGFWNGVGMVARQERAEVRRLVPQGMTSFSPDEGLELLGRILADGRPAVAVLPADWARWARAYPRAAQAPLLTRLVTDRAPASETAEGDAPEPAVTAPAVTAPDVPVPDVPVPDVPVPATPAAEPAGGADLAELLDFLRQEVAAVMGTRPERVNLNRPLSRIGMDSLMAVELRNRIQRAYRVKLPMVRLLKDGTVTTVAEALATELTTVHVSA